MKKPWLRPGRGLLIVTIIGVLISPLNVLASSLGIQEGHGLQILAISDGDEFTGKENTFITNGLLGNMEYYSKDFDGMVIDVKHLKDHVDLAKDFVNNGKPVLYFGNDLNVEELQKALFGVPDYEIYFDPEFGRDIKAIYVSMVGDAPFFGVIAYPTTVIIDDEEKASGVDQIDFYADITNAINSLKMAQQFGFSNISQDTSAMVTDSEIQSFPPGTPYFTQYETVLYVNGTRYARNVCVVYASKSLNKPSYSQWDFIASMQAIPERTNVYVLNYKTRLGVDFANQQLIDWTDLASNRSQTLAFQATSPYVSWSTDISGYDATNYGGYSEAFEWRINKRLLGEPWGQAQVARPGIRALNYSGDVGIERHYYAEYWVGAGGDGFVLKTPNYYYATEYIRDR